MAAGTGTSVQAETIRELIALSRTLLSSVGATRSARADAVRDTAASIIDSARRILSDLPTTDPDRGACSVALEQLLHALHDVEAMSS